MNRQYFNNEENFWPCVSDMFLAFFVIALALYSNCHQEKGNGDVYISWLASQEAKELILTLHREHPSIVSQLTEEEKQETEEEKRGTEVEKRKRSVDCPLLAQRLYLLTKKQELLDTYFRLPEKEVLAPYAPQDNEPYNIRQATRLLYIATKHDMSSQEKLPDVDAPEYHKHLRIVRKHIEEVINKKKIKKGELIDDSKEELTKKINKLRADRYAMQEKLTQANQKLTQANQKVADLEKEKERLDELVKISSDNKQLLDKIEKLKQNIKGKDNEIETLVTKKKLLEKQINKDIRKSVMEEVRKIIKNQFPELDDNRINLLDEEGVIRIPESFIGFESEEWEPRPANIENVNLIADLLGELAKRIKEGTLKIDNISIECHADRRGGRLGRANLYVGKKSGKIDIDNDWLSMMRAWSVWNKMENHRKKDSKLSLAEYRSKSTGLGLFSTSGFGSRVPVKRKEGEDENAFHSRCRRMDIRLNCSPDKGTEHEQHNQWIR